MRISTKGRYALRLMVDLARNSGAGPVSLKDIARRQDISDKYLEQIISVLNRAGYVRSLRGAQGGYFLQRPPEEYTVGMILRLTEGSLAPAPCVDEATAPCGRQEGCAAAVLRKKISDAVSSVVDQVTLQDLMTWQNGIDSECVI